MSCGAVPQFLKEVTVMTARSNEHYRSTPSFMLLTTLVSQFETCTLRKTDWTHEAHLSVGTWYVKSLGSEQALKVLRERIRSYNESVGTINSDESGYHETITCVYIKLIDYFLNTVDPSLSADDCSKLLISRFGERNFLLKFYSHERLFSVLARRSWVDPDLQPLEFER
jgi:hypothetical protein